MKNVSRLFAVCLAAVTLTSCNVFSVFEGSGSDNDKLELGEACLNEGDFTCARQEYEQIQAPALRTEKLCLLGLTQSGLTISTLIKIIVDGNGSSKILGTLANAFPEFSSQTLEGANLALAQCPAHFTVSQTRKSALLLALAGFSSCAVRVTRAEYFETEDNTTCVTKAGGGGAITPVTVAVDVNGVASAGNPGMCKEDIDACLQGFVAIANGAASLGQDGLEKILAAFNALPADLKNSAAVTDAKRKAVRDTL